LGCVSKGVSEAVEDTTDSSLVTINKTIATNIATNMTFIKSTYDYKNLVLEALINPDSTSSIYSSLNTIKEAYNYGEITQTTVKNKYAEILEKKVEFFQSNSLQTYDNIVATYSNITKQISALNLETSPNTDHLAHLDIIESQLLIYKTYIDERLKENPYFVELEVSFWLKDYLDNNKTTVEPKITYRELLVYYGILDNSTLQEKYSKLISLIDNELNVLNNVNVITDVNQLIYYSAPKITSKYAIKDIISTAQVTDIKNKLTNLKSLYQNYSTNASNIYAKEQELFLIERDYLSTLTADYYYKIRMSGTKLSVQTLNGLNLYDELTRIYNTANPIGDMEKVYIIKNNLSYMLGKIESYNALNLKDSYSACVISAQLLQMLKDNKVFIEDIRAKNP
jgi:hypothetical protein